MWGKKSQFNSKIVLPVSVFVEIRGITFGVSIAYPYESMHIHSC